MEVEAKVLHQLAQEQDNHYSFVYAPIYEHDDLVLFIINEEKSDLHVHLVPIEQLNAFQIGFDQDERCL